MPRAEGRERLRDAFAGAAPALVCYVAAGDPTFIDAPLELYAGCGVDVAEIGLPSPTPYVDGPVVSASMARSLAAGATPHSIASTVVRPANGPAVVWMCYPDAPLDDVEEHAATGAVDAILMIDWHKHPQAQDLRARLGDAGVATCAFVRSDWPSSDLAAADEADGYVMLAARAGVSGTDAEPDDRLAERVSLAKTRWSVPIVIGFGIDGPERARDAASTGVDGVVVGTACVDAAVRGTTSLKDLIVGLRSTLDTGSASRG